MKILFNPEFDSIPEATIIPSTSVISGFFLSVSLLSFANYLM
jgi:hypothetical protein